MCDLDHLFNDEERKLQSLSPKNLAGPCALLLG